MAFKEVTQFIQKDTGKEEQKKTKKQSSKEKKNTKNKTGELNITTFIIVLHLNVMFIFKNSPEQVKVDLNPKDLATC